MNLFDFADNLATYSPTKFLNDLGETLAQSDEATDLQRQQWQKGEDVAGNVLGLYSKQTEILSNGSKVAGTPYTLLDTGDFYANTHLFNTQKTDTLLLNFDSPGGKNTVDLLKKIGARMFGLQPQSIDKLTQIAQESANNLLSTNLKLK
jgi:hypothetical protein